MMTGVGRLYNRIKPFKECRDLLIDALSFAESKQLISVILHNLTVINFAERQFHNEKDNVSEDERFQKLTFSESLRDRTEGTEVDEKGNLVIK